MNNHDAFLFDRRLINRHLKSKLITQKDLDKYIENSQDISYNAQVIQAQFPEEKEEITQEK